MVSYIYSAPPLKVEFSFHSFIKSNNRSSLFLLQLTLNLVHNIVVAKTKWMDRKLCSGSKLYQFAMVSNPPCVVLLFLLHLFRFVSLIFSGSFMFFFLDYIHLFNFVKCPICLSIRNDHNYSYKGNIVFSTQHFHDITKTTRKRFRLLYAGSN